MGQTRLAEHADGAGKWSWRRHLFVKCSGSRPYVLRDWMPRGGRGGDFNGELRLPFLFTRMTGLNHFMMATGFCNCNILPYLFHLQKLA